MYIYNLMFSVHFYVNHPAKYVCKSEGKSWTYQKAKSLISEAVEMSQSINLKKIEKLVDEESEMYPLGPTMALAYLSVLKDCEVHCLNEGSEVKKLGGLHVIGTSLHESRRIDNQVRGLYFMMVSVKNILDSKATTPSVLGLSPLRYFSLNYFLVLCYSFVEEQEGKGILDRHGLW
jgi:hypothetical protein